MKLELIKYELPPQETSSSQKMDKHSSFTVILFFLLFNLLPFSAIAAAEDQHNNGVTTTTTRSSSIIFATLGRANYAFDIFTLPIISDKNTPNPHQQQQQELQLTDGQSVNFNGFFASPSSSSLLSLISNQSHLFLQTQTPNSLQLLLYITERDGSSNIYLDASNLQEPTSRTRRSAIQIQTQVQIPLLHQHDQHQKKISMKDRPSISGEFLIYVSTHEDPKKPRKSWAAVYSTHLRTGKTRRLTPHGVADFSPSISPSGLWTAVASSGEKGWDGDIEDLKTQIFIFKTSDGSERIKVVDHGGWPCWVDDFTFYFHRASDDGWWSIYKAVLPKERTSINGANSIVIERVTPPGVHAFTPAVSATNKRFIAIATRRPTSDFRHIELFDIDRNEFVELTSSISPEAHHYNPFFAIDGTRVGYHRCRGSNNGGKTSSNPLLLENIKSPNEEISLFRIDGSFPSFSPNGDRIAYAGFPGLYVVNRDGSNKRMVFPGLAFSTAWDWKRKGVVYTSTGPTFASESTQVDIISVNVDNDSEQTDGNHVGCSSSVCSYKKLTIGGENNAFPSPSPDGKFVVFRSGRSGHKNLYIMDAIDGEKGGIQRLTDGKWTDTMCNWSPDGEWIAFASDRHNPGGGSFAIYFIHPNGTGLKRVVHSGEGGRTNHPWFSPDARSFVFTTDYAAVSAEPIGNPHHYQPYGDIFMARSDGTGIQRLTHNSYEDGTPAWGPTFMKPVDVVEASSGGSRCSFDDCHWLAKNPNNAVGEVLSKPSCI